MTFDVCFDDEYKMFIVPLDLCLKEEVVMPLRQQIHYMFAFIFFVYLFCFFVCFSVLVQIRVKWTFLDINVEVIWIRDKNR